MAFGFQLHWKTHVAHFAVKESILAADATNAARIAMVLGFVIVIEQIADEASVLAEANAALFAIGLNLLTRLTLGADQLFQLLAIECVRLRVVMTEAAGVNLSATRALKWNKSRVLAVVQ